ncbi:MAG: c-type cytochrome [Gemmataceae bacterium]|nr:c-type cytochrome [Gemmataceae bacterium]
MNAVLLLGALAVAQPHVSEAPHQSPAAERAGFTVPDGFEVQLVAAEPEITKPINLAFDARGRLWVTCTTDYPFPAPDGKGKDTVRILSDFGPDGRARKVETFAEGLNIPIGILPYQDGAIVYSIPNLWMLRDTDSDGKCDKREVLYSGFGHRDTHGMVNSLFRGFDGWIYANHGYANDSVVRGTDGHEIRMNSGNVFRFRPDGTRVELYARGQVNPFGSCMDKWGNLFTACCHSRPITLVMRGAVYESFAKPHDGLGFGPPMVHEYRGSTALCGLAWYEADHFPKEYQERFYLGDVVNNCINMFTVSWEGATPTAKQASDLLTSKDPWFRPVDIKLGPDGALYVADFYNRIIGHYEVPLDHPGRDRTSGRIWRIVRKDVPLAAVPDRRKSTFKSLSADLSSNNIAVRLTAINELADRGLTPDMPEINRDEHLEIANNWLVFRRSGPQKPDLVETQSPVVAVHRLRAAMESPRWSAVDIVPLARFCVHEHATVRRMALEALGVQCGNVRGIDVAADRVINDASDPFVVYAARMALKESLKVQEPSPMLGNQSLWPVIADAARSARSIRGAQWIVAWLRDVPGAELTAEHVSILAQFCGSETMQQSDLLARMRAIGDRDLSRQCALAGGLLEGSRAGNQELVPEAASWCESVVARAMKSPDLPGVQRGLVLVGLMRSPSVDAMVLSLAEDRSRNDSVRCAAMERLTARNVSALARLLSDASESIAIRESASRTLGQLNRPESRTAMLSALPTAPKPVAVAIALGLAGGKPGADQLCDLVEQGKASPQLLIDRAVRARLESIGLKDRVSKLTAALPPADQLTENLINRRRAAFAKAKPDPAAGKELFTKHCAICHQVGGQGAKVGPHLDGIGVRGSDRLLEDVLDPNRNVDPSFRQTTMQLDDGRSLTGLVIRDEGATVTITDSLGKETTVARERIERRTTSLLSAMPANVGEVMNDEEFARLLSYLMTLR